MEKLYELKKGCICEFHTAMEESHATEELHNLCTSQAKYFLLLKYIDENQVLAAQICSHQVKNTKRIRINRTGYWVKFDNFVVLPKVCVSVAAGKKLDDVSKTLTELYQTHKLAKQYAWRKKQLTESEDRLCKKGVMPYAGRAERKGCRPGNQAG